MTKPDFEKLARKVLGSMADSLLVGDVADFGRRMYAAGEAEGAADTARLDKLADDRAFDGFNGIDIDDATYAAIHADPSVGDADMSDPDEKAWRLEWRRQMRIAIDSLKETA